MCNISNKSYRRYQSLTPGHDSVRKYNRTTVVDILTHCSLVMPHRNINLVQHWLGQWLVTWCHQAITWTNVEFSLVKFCGIHLRTISQRAPKLLFCIMRLKIILLKLLLHLQGTTEWRGWPTQTSQELFIWYLRGESMHSFWLPFEISKNHITISNIQIVW